MKKWTPCSLHADDDDGEKHHERERGGDDDLARHRERIGNEADQIGQQDEKEDREDKREKTHARLAGGGADHAGDELVSHFGHGLQPAGNTGAAARAERDQEAGEGDRQQHIEAGIGQGDVMASDFNRNHGMNGELVDRIDRRSRLCRHAL